MFARATLVALAAILTVAGGAMADTFGTGANQFSLAFVPISGATNPTVTQTQVLGGYGIVNHDYRMGTYDITNDQWNKFSASLGVPVTGAEGGGYTFTSSYWTGANVPVNAVSWFEAAQFVNWLNTSTGHQAAYNFTGTQGTSNYAFATWSPSDVGYNSNNPYRNSNAFYYLPTEDEWVKAGYWNGTSLQTYATKGNMSPPPGDGVSGTGWNYYLTTFATNSCGPWAVGSGSQELNGTYDMMGNVWQWQESPFLSGYYHTLATRVLRGGSFARGNGGELTPLFRNSNTPYNKPWDNGFRVAANVPEPCSLALLAMGGLAILRRRRS